MAHTLGDFEEEEAGTGANPSPSGSVHEYISSNVASDDGPGAANGEGAVLDAPAVSAGAALGTAASWWSCNTVYGNMKCCTTTSIVTV